MKCQEIEQVIYFYAELSADEKSKVDYHISRCAACALLFNEWKHAEEWISRTKEIPLFPENAARLTHRVMNAIEPMPKATGLEFVWSGFSSQWVRYSLAILSVISIVFFTAEQQRYQTKVWVNNTSDQMSVVLNSGSFIKARQRDRENQTNISFTSLQNCARQKDCNHSLIENFKSKRAL